MKTGPVLDIPGSKYSVEELSLLDPPACCPALAPDGERLAFATCRTMVQKVYIQNVGGSDLKEISSLRINDGDGPCPDPAWSPDGQQIAFVSDRNGNREIYVMNSDGTDQRRLTYHQAQDWGPVWSPDGRQIVFTSDRNGQTGVYIINSDGTDEKWLMITDAPQRWPMDTTRVRFVETAR